MSKWLHVVIRCEALWPDHQKEVIFGEHSFILRPGSNNAEKSIHIKMDHISELDAMKYVNQFLSVLAWAYDRRVEKIYSSTGPSGPQEFSRLKDSIKGQNEVFPNSIDSYDDPDKVLAMALYREAISINSIPYRFLGFFKILNMFWNEKFQNKKSPIIEGIRETLLKIKDVEAAKRIKAITKDEKDVAEYLYQSGRCAIAHAYQSPVVNPDDPEDIRRLYADMPVIRALAEYKMENDLGLERRIF